MQITIKTEEFVHIPDRSYYNNNLYWRKEQPCPHKREIYIFEICDEFSNTYELYECDKFGDNKVLLGCYTESDCPEWGKVGTLELEFGLMWT